MQKLTCPPLYPTFCGKNFVPGERSNSGQEFALDIGKLPLTLAQDSLRNSKHDVYSECKEKKNEQMNIAYT